MMTQRKLGIWMDHSTANVMEYSAQQIRTITIHSKFTYQAKEESLNKGERKMHNKETVQQAEYFKELSRIIIMYDMVLLFGPTDAKAELHNRLLADHQFEKVTFEIRNTDKMTENQQHAFVKDYFATNKVPIAKEDNP